MQQIDPKIVIVGGTGKMGRWFQSLFQKNKLQTEILGRSNKNELPQKVQRADIIIVSVPISQTSLVISEVIPHVRKDALLCDITSLKKIAQKEFMHADCATLGMHPLFGPSIISPEGQKIVFCQDKDNNNIYKSFLQELFSREKMLVIELSAEEHDRQMAYIQALTHTLSIVFANTLLHAKIDERLQTPIFKLQSLVMQRVLQQDPQLMTDIQLNNPYFPEVLKEFMSHTKQIERSNITQNKKSLIKILDKLHSTNEVHAPLAIRQTNKILAMLTEKSVPAPFEKIKKINRKQLTISFLGPEGTNSHIAALGIKNINTLLKPQQTIPQIFLSVENGESDLGVIPAENSIHGTVRETFDLLVDFPLQTIGSFDMPIHHSLLSLEKDLNNIKNVVSHPQALAQCKEWLKNNLPNASLTESASTTSVLKNPRDRTAYIASIEASNIYETPVLATNIEDNTSNTTRFYIISKNDFPLPLRRENTLLFLSIFNRVGILRDILEVFTHEGISLNKIESRPSTEKMWDYCFYIEVDRNIEDKQLKESLKKLEPFCTSIRILGRT